MLLLIPSEHAITCVHSFIDTRHPRVYPVNAGDHAPANLRATFQTSLKILGPQKVRVLYLHAPDRSVPFEDTLREVNELYKANCLYVDSSLSYSAQYALRCVFYQRDPWAQQLCRLGGK